MITFHGEDQDQILWFYCDCGKGEFGISYPRRIKRKCSFCNKTYHTKDFLEALEDGMNNEDYITFTLKEMMKSMSKLAHLAKEIRNE